MKPAEQLLLDAVAGGETPAVLLATDTRVDVGQWFRSGRVWVAGLAERVVVLAAGPRAHCEVLPRPELGKSFYNFLTGELVLAPAPAATVHRFKMAPLAAQQLLEQINRKEVSTCL